MLGPPVVVLLDHQRLASPLRDIDLKIAVGNHLLEPIVFLPELPEALDVGQFQRPEPFPSRVDGLITDAVHLRHVGDRSLVRFVEDPDHLLFREPRLLHGSLSGLKNPVPSKARGLTVVVVRKTKSPQGAVLSGFRWSEKRQADHWNSFSIIVCQVAEPELTHRLF